MRQIELEKRWTFLGAEQARLSMAEAEQQGEANRNPYAMTLYREFVEPLQAFIAQEVGDGKAGRRAAHKGLLKPFEPWSVAYIAVRVVIDTLMSVEPTARVVSNRIGQVLYNELYLEQFAGLSPDLYHVIDKGLGRNLSKDMSHRIRVYQAEVRKQGMELVQWPAGAREQVGMYLLECLTTLGMVTLTEKPREQSTKHPDTIVSFTPEVTKAIEQVKGFVEVSRPMLGACVEPPIPWTSVFEGGFHTERMRRRCPLVSIHTAALPHVQAADLSTVLSAVNALQSTAWRVNTRVLDAVTLVGGTVNTGELIGIIGEGAPQRPAWLDTQDKGNMTDEQQQEFISWKRATAVWHTGQVMLGSKHRRYLSATKTAEFYRDYPAIYFVHYADSRGRLYPYTRGISPQGSDVQKGLLMFAEGLPLDTEDAVKWFYIHGANKAGFDKASLAERAKWHEAHRDVILACATDPLDNLFWLDVDNPVQFLAWCYEYKDYYENPESFVSHLPVSLDGTCSGLQHYSAMLRDEVGGFATNLMYSKERQDIYAEVAAKAYQLMVADTTEDETGLRAIWIKRGVGRDIAKRGTMTTPYGVSKRTVIQNIVEDILVLGKAPEFQKSDYFQAAHIVGHYIWEAIGTVVVKAREAMAYLKQAGKSLAKDSSGVISWITPSGFPATQTYFETTEHRITTRLFGKSRILILSESPDPSTSRHSSSLAPNFVHSCDAAHLHLTVHHLCSKGIGSFAMIHDDFGVHPSNTQVLYDAIRSTFVDMYSSHHPLHDFASQHSLSDELPNLGSLSIEEVLSSEFFFS